MIFFVKKSGSQKPISVTFSIFGETLSQSLKHRKWILNVFLVPQEEPVALTPRQQLCQGFLTLGLFTRKKWSALRRTRFGCKMVASSYNFEGAQDTFKMSSSVHQNVSILFCIKNEAFKKNRFQLLKGDETCDLLLRRQTRKSPYMHITYVIVIS